MKIENILGFCLFWYCAGTSFAASAPGSSMAMRFLYPTVSATFAAPWIAKEAGYFAAEGLDVELIRVGGSTRIVAAMLGGSAPIIHAGAPASMTASAAGSDAVIIGCMSNVSPFHLMA
ncbi:MAG TPA: ABC transporter substrate-binding protein, partial [Candidatus Binatus sp.]|nr:ABC transporter substrate-binding protein [Candidatus Binatus sp.]